LVAENIYSHLTLVEYISPVFCLPSQKILSNYFDNYLQLVAENIYPQ
jgi:hypothetical protein